MVKVGVCLETCTQEDITQPCGRLRPWPHDSLIMMMKNGFVPKSRCAQYACAAELALNRYISKKTPLCGDAAPTCLLKVCFVQFSACATCGGQPGAPMFLQAYEHTHSSGVSKLSFVYVEVVLLGGEDLQPLER